MMSPSTSSPMHNHRGGGGGGASSTASSSLSYGPDDVETAPLMQRNYLGGSGVVGVGNGGNPNEATNTAHRRKMGGEIEPSPMSTSTLGGGGSGIGRRRANIAITTTNGENGIDDKDHGHKTASRILGFFAAVGRACAAGAGAGPISPTSKSKDERKYYRDDFNDQSWSCTFGTSEEDGVWMNTRDQAGTILAFTVWFLLVYSMSTVTMLAETGGIPSILSYLYSTLCALALASHAKTTFTDPGAVPQAAMPMESARQASAMGHSMCSQCQTFKPPFSHHCRICNRCVSRMDHHCPWMNNCIGSGNMKHFLLFLLYAWACSALSLGLLGWNYFMCSDEDCTFTPVLIQLVRVMTVLSTGSFLFTSSMLMNVCYGLMTGIGTIDRLKKKAANTLAESIEEPIPLKDVFGLAPYYTWPFPVDPIFEDYDRVMGYSTPQRLLREQLRENPNAGGTAGGLGGEFVGHSGSAASSSSTKSITPPPYPLQHGNGVTSAYAPHATSGTDKFMAV